MSARARFSRAAAAAAAVLLVASATAYASRVPGIVWPLSLLGGAIVLLVVYAALNPVEVRSLLARRSTRHGANAALMTVLFIGAIVLAVAIASRNRRQFDLTANARFTLAPQTREVMGSLATDVTIYAFYRRTSAQRNSAEQLLDLYEESSAHVFVEFVDPDRRPTLAQEMGVRYETMVVTSGTRRRVVDRLGEEAITNAVLQVSLDRYKAIYFVTGHDERDINEVDRIGYTAAVAGLRAQGYDVRELSLLDVVSVPDDCEVLVVAGPRRPYLEAEGERIAAYLRSGGRAMIMMDPRQSNPPMETVLAEYRIVLDPAVLLDELVLVDSSENMFDATVTKIRRYEKHAITRDFNMATLYPMARPVRIVDDPSDTRTDAQYLGITEKSAWGERDMESFKRGRATRDGSDLAPPLPVSAVIARRVSPAGVSARREARVVVAGDSDFANNSFYGVLGNSDFFLNCVRYLAEDENRISIRPRTLPGDAVYIPASEGRLIFAITLVLLPLSVILTGATVLWRQRNN